MSYQVGFSHSFKMLTSQKGWWKPIAVLTLIAWIPIVGQVALLGYGLEWARLTAWGVDSAPKRSGLNYGKIARTGAIAFIVAATMSIVVAALNLVIFGSSFATSAFPALTGTVLGVGAFLSGSTSVLLYIMMLVVNLFMGTFVSAAMMRSTIYDTFSAGWRLDRLFHMVARDVAGFARVYLVSLVGGIVNWLYTAFVTLMGLIVAGIGFVGLASVAPSLSMMGEADLTRMLYVVLTSVGPASVLVIVVVVLALCFVGAALGVAVQLVSMDAMGRWFRRFDVARWGVSADPLPEGTPLVSGFSVHDAADATAPQGTPKAPAEASPREDAAAGSAAQAASSPWPVDAQPADEGEVSAAKPQGEGEGSKPADDKGSVEAPESVAAVTASLDAEPNSKVNAVNPAATGQAESEPEAALAADPDAASAAVESPAPEVEPEPEPAPEVPAPAIDEAAAAEAAARAQQAIERDSE